MSRAHETVHYSVIIPAYNEERFLSATLAAVAAAMQEVAASGEIIVVDNNSSDRTAAVAESHGAEVVFEPINQISRARNTGAAVARGRHFIFVDADTSVSGALLAAAVASLDAEDVCGGGARVVIKHSNRFVQATVSCWNFVARSAGLAAGCFVFCRRDAFTAIGGFSESVYASEEIWLSLALARWGRRSGRRFIILDEGVLTSARKADWMSGCAIAKQILILLVFPLAVRSKRFCGAWYKRPESRTGP